MGIFSKKNYEGDKKRDDLIHCNKFIQDLPAHYGKRHRFPQLNDQEETQYNIVLKYLQSEELNLVVGSSTVEASDASVSQLRESEKLWLTKECITRFLRATKWDAKCAIERLTKTIMWRREIGCTLAGTLINYETIAKENEDGRLIFLGYDRKRQLVCLLKYRSNSTLPTFVQLQQIIWFLEVSSILSPQGSEKVTVLVDFNPEYNSSESISFKEFLPLSFTKQVINILQDNYPELLERAVIENVPAFVWPFLKLIHPLIDPSTRKKLIFEEPFENYVEADQLEQRHNGRVVFDYDVDIYWPHLKNVIEERRRHQLKRFQELGGVVGLSEYDLKMDN